MSHTIIDQCSGCTACKNVCPTHAIRGERKLIHVIDDARCIDCGACGRICTFAAVLNQHNQLCEHLRYTEWQKPRFDLHLCTACGLCIQACPVSCLGFDQPQKGDKTCYPHLATPRNCLGCRFCMEICPVDAVQMAALII